MLNDDALAPAREAGLRAPGPKSYSPLGQLRELQDDPIALLERSHQLFGDVFRMRIFIWPMYVLAHPDHVQHVLQENYRGYHKFVVYEFLKPVVGTGLLTSEDEFWRKQRRTMQPAFHHRAIASLVSGMTDETSAMLQRWWARPAADGPIDVLAEMMGLTLEIVSKTMLSTDVAADTATVRDSVSVLRDHVNHRMMHVLTLPERFPTGRNRKFRRAIEAVDRIVYGMIEDRRAGLVDASDLLSMLLNARDEGGEGMSDKQLRDEVMTVFLAGHETTANALAWTLYLLGEHPEVEERLCQEVEAVLAGRVPTLQDLPRLTYTKMVLEESLRLYPPVWAFGRQSLADDEVGGYRIPANAGVLVSPWLTHRHPSFWEKPERFDPERFSPERTAARPRFAYLPFGGGPRQCIGSEFALMEGQLVLAMIAQSFRLRLVPGHRVEPEPVVTLRPKGGLPMTIAARS